MAQPRPSSESGFAIIEVIVSAVVLAIVALAVLSGIDGATGSSGREKARAVASALAEQDQERMRSMTVDGLKGVTSPAPVVIDGATYTTKSEAVFVTDDTGGTPSCGNSSNNAEYFHITSTVTSNITGVRTPAVKIDSLVSPSVAYSQSHGTLGAKIVDRNGAPVTNMSVTATGASSQSGTTDQNGCVLWRSIPIGSYTVKLNVAGWCDESGNTNLSRGQSVSPNTVSFVNFTYDRCAAATVSVKTHVPGQAFSTALKWPSKSREISDIGSNGSLKNWVSTTTPNPPGGSTYSVSNLFPYPTKPYGFFTGECQWQNPETAGIANYFTTTNTAASMLANPSPAVNTATVYQPPVRIKVTRGSAGGTVQPANGTVNVYFSLKKPAAFASDDCADDRFIYTITDWPATWLPIPILPYDSKGWVSQTSSSFDPGLPFGDYDVCFEDTTVSPRKYYSTTYNNKLADGGALLEIKTQTWVSSSCVPAS